MFAAPSGVSVRKRSKYKSESEERLREFRDKCSVRDTDVFTRSQLKSQNVDISGTKRATKNLRIPNWSYRRGDSFSGPKLQLNGLEHAENGLGLREMWCERDGRHLNNYKSDLDVKE